MTKTVTYELRLPKRVKIDSIDITSIPIDESWVVAVHENHRTIAEVPLKHARRARY